MNCGNYYLTCGGSLTEIMERARMTSCVIITVLRQGAEIALALIIIRWLVTSFVFPSSIITQH